MHYMYVLALSWPGSPQQLHHFKKLLLFSSTTRGPVRKIHALGRRGAGPSAQPLPSHSLEALKGCPIDGLGLFSP